MISRATISCTRVVKPLNLPRLRANSPFAKLVVSHSGWIAQLVEQWTENPCVAGSIPAPTTSSEQQAVTRVAAFLLRRIWSVLAHADDWDCSQRIDQSTPHANRRRQ